MIGVISKKQVHTVVCLEPTGHGMYKVKKSFSYKDVVIEVGDEFNGANIWGIMKVFLNKFAPFYMPAFIIHDRLCEEGKYKKADNYIEEVIELSHIVVGTEVSTLSRTIVRAVRAYSKYGRRAINWIKSLF